MRGRGSMGRVLAVLGLVVVLGLQETVCAYASEPGVLEIPMDEAVRAPVKLTFALGHVILIRAGARPQIKSVGDPGIVHAIARERDVLLVPLRQGRTPITIGFEGQSSVLFDVTVGADAGVRSVVLTGAPVVDGMPPGQASLAPAAEPASLPAFLGGLSADQRDALLRYLRDPTLDQLSAVMKMLAPPQQETLMRLLGQKAPDIAPASPQTSAPPGNADQLPSTAVPGGGAALPDAPGARVSAPPGVRVTVVPTSVGATLYVSYVFQNLTGHTLRADPHDLEIVGTRETATVRQMDIGEPGVIAPANVETGVIALTPATPAVRLTWVLRGDGSALLPVEVTLETGSYRFLSKQ
jgi:hypothetical protein